MPRQRSVNAMYLARTSTGGNSRYVIRESYPEGPHMASRDLLDLGADPGRFIVYPGGRTYIIDDRVEDALRDLEVAYDPEELYALFFPFLDPEMRWKMAWAHERRSRRPSRTETPGQGPYHLFDRRRIHFLKSGAMDQRGLGRMPTALLRVLDAKSRDEIEQDFMRREAVLSPSEQKAYVFVIFDLQRFFTENFARTQPQMLSREEVDDRLVDAVCRLNDDGAFWAGTAPAEGLNAYLVRYVTMYFDNDYGHSRFLDDLMRNFIHRHRQYRPPAQVRATMAEAADLFQVDTDTLRRMPKAELSRLFRRRAHKLHPDKGGDHERFVRLAEAYRGLLRKKR